MSEATIQTPLQTALSLTCHPDDYEKVLRLLHATAITAWNRSALVPNRTDSEIAAESRVYARMTQEIEAALGQPISAFQPGKSTRQTRVPVGPEAFDRIKAVQEAAKQTTTPPT